MAIMLYIFFSFCALFLLLPWLGLNSPNPATVLIVIKLLKKKNSRLYDFLGFVREVIQPGTI